MKTFPEFREGDPFVPSASFFESVRHLVERYETTQNASETYGVATESAFLLGYTEDTSFGNIAHKYDEKSISGIPAFSITAVEECTRMSDGTTLYKLMKLTDGNAEGATIAVTLDPISVLSTNAPHSVGRICIAGVARLRVSGTTTGSHISYNPNDAEGPKVSLSETESEILSKTINGPPQLIGTPTGGIADVLLGSGGSSGGAVSKCKTAIAVVQSGSSSYGYIVNLFENGVHKPSTRTGTLFISEIADGSDLPVGSTVLAHPCMVLHTGGNET